MLHNLRYLDDGEPPYYMTPEEDEEDDPQGDPFAGELAAAQIQPRIAPLPPGYVSPDDSGSLAPDSAVAPLGGPEPKMMPVIRHEQVPVTWKDEKGVVHKANALTANRDAIPSPYKDPASVGAPISPGWIAGNETENPLPFRPGALPEKAPRYIGQDIDYQGAQKTARGADAEMPIRPMPKLLNRIGAGALGAAAGWSNAARRAAPIDIKEATDPILYPGYDRQVASWQSRQAAAKQQVQDFGQQVSAEIASQKAQSEAQLKYAQAKAAIEHGDYWERRSEQERNQWKIAPDGSLYNTITGQRGIVPQNSAAKYKAAMAITGGDKQASAFYALNGKLPSPTQHNTSKEQMYLDANGGDPNKALAAQRADEIAKARESRDPSVANFRSFEEELHRNQDMDAVQKTRNDAEHRILTDRQAKLTGLTTAGQSADRAARTAQINRDAAAQLQSMQEEYAAAIRRRGGSATDFNVDPTTLEWKPRPAPGNPYRPAATNPYPR